MLKELRPALVMTILFTILTGIAYPLAITGLGQVLLPDQANGSLLKRGDVVVGSRLIGQNFASPRYFHGRPSATSAPDPTDSTKTVDAPYNAANSSGSNLGPTAQKLVDRVKADVATLREAGLTGPVPADAITTSASGLDPDISPAYANAQVARIAEARGLDPLAVKALVAAHTETGLVGEPRVNVLLLNLDLDGPQR